MTDYFELLGQKRAPWLEADAVEQAFLAASGSSHPDRVHSGSEEERRTANERTAAINQAHLCLRNPRTRLRHFLELERQARITDLQEIPDSLMATFMEVGRRLAAADQLVDEAAGVTSPLIKVALFERAQEMQQLLREEQQRLESVRGELEARVRSTHLQWETLPRQDTDRRETLLSELETAYRLLSFHERWIEQLGARGLRLLALS